MLTLALERADGIERVVFACHIAESLLASNIGADQILGALATWIEHDFEPIREAALKTIRTERKLHEIVFDQEHPGPFRTS